MAQVEHNLNSNQSNGPDYSAPALPTGDAPAKTYHSRIAGSTFIDRKGDIHQFNHAGEFTTTRKDLQKEMEDIADKAGSPIYFKGHSPVVVESDVAPVTELQEKVAIATAKLAQSQGR